MRRRLGAERLESAGKEYLRAEVEDDIDSPLRVVRRIGGRGGQEGGLPWHVGTGKSGHALIKNSVPNAGVVHQYSQWSSAKTTEVEQSLALWNLE